MIFEIPEKRHELTEGYFIFSMKIFSLLLAAWMTDILLLYLYPCFAWGYDRFPPFIVWMDKTRILTWFFILIYGYIFYLKIYRKYSLGLITSFSFGEKNLTIKIINTLNGKEREIDLTNAQSHVETEEKNSFFYGKHIVYHFYNNLDLITNLTIDANAWKRHPEIEIIKQELDKFKKR